jgi:virginiamycin B lyase
VPVASTHPTPTPTPTPGKTLSSGGVIEYPVPNPPPVSVPGCSTCGNDVLGKVALGADGNVWFADPAHNKVGRITPAGVITELDIPGKGFRVPSLIGDRSGNVWVAAQGVDGEGPGWIIRITGAGAITRFSIPYAPAAVALGSDGNVWFTEGDSGQLLGRLTPAGVYTQFPLPSPGHEPAGTYGYASVGIVAGPGRDLWFVERYGVIGGGDRTVLARVNTAGKGKQLPMGAVPDQYSAQSIAVGPDGNLWIGARGEIDRMTPAGAFTSFPLPKDADAADLTSGPDGNLWFLDADSHSIGRITVQGVVREFALPWGASPYGLAAGSDGRMWFAEAGYKIGSIGVTVPVPSFSAHILNFSAAPGAAQQLTVQNSGDGVLNITAVSVAGPGAATFHLSTAGCSGQSLKPRDRCSVSVSVAGGSTPAGAYLELFDNATDSPQRAYLVAGLTACRLPVHEPSGDPSTPSTSGFLDVTTGVVQDDPGGVFTFDPATRLYRSSTTPVLAGSSPATYDGRARRWVPTGAVSPDGSRYAYEAPVPNSTLSTVHVVDVTTGRDRNLDLPKASWIIRSYAAEGIYLGQGYESLVPGLWLVNPDTGALAVVFSQGQVAAVGDGAAWLSARNAADPHPPVVGGVQAYDEVVRRDLLTGAITTWLYMPGVELGVSMVVGKTIVVGAVRDGVGTMLMVPAPNVAQPLKAPEVGEDLWAFYGASATGQGVWIPGHAGHLYLWTPTTGLILVADTAAIPAGICA